MNCPVCLKYTAFARCSDNRLHIQATSRFVHQVSLVVSLRCTNGFMGVEVGDMFSDRLPDRWCNCMGSFLGSLRSISARSEALGRRIPFCRPRLRRLRSHWNTLSEEISCCFGIATYGRLCLAIYWFPCIRDGICTTATMYCSLCDSHHHVVD